MTQIPVLFTLTFPHLEHADNLPSSDNDGGEAETFFFLHLSGYVLVQPVVGSTLLLDVPPFIRQNREEEGLPIMLRWKLKYESGGNISECLNRKRLEVSVSIDHDFDNLLNKFYGGNINDLITDIVHSFKEAGFRVEKSPREAIEESDQLLGYQRQEQTNPETDDIEKDASRPKSVH